MKRYTLFTLICLILLFGCNVYACGEIKELKTNVGTVSVVNSSNYLITIPEGTSEVTIDATTDYTWVDNYGPRTVNTDEKVELKVDGNACGFGIYTYFVSFKTYTTAIAETTPAPENSTPTETTPDVGTNENLEGNEQDSNLGEEAVLKLSDLTIAGIDLDFDPNKFEYDIDVAEEVKVLSIDPIVPNDTILISVSDNAYSLSEGTNAVTITLTDTLGNETVYTLNVTRVKQKSNNNFLANITIDGYQLNFDPSITTYSLSIGKEKILSINAVTESELSTYQILGNNNLDDGSSITIRVTAEDESTRDYVLNITKEFNIMDYWIYIVIVLLLLLLIILLLIMRQKKNKKKLGPEALETPKDTAGSVQEIAPQNLTNSANAETSPIQNVQASGSATSTNATLQIIEPSDIEVTGTDGIASADEESPTEVFQL